MTTAGMPRRHLAALWLIVLGATLWPILGAEVPPGADMPNHLARAHILEHAAGDADLRRFYDPAWAILPNLAVDAVMAVLAPLTDTYTAGRAALVLAVLLLFAGVGLLRRQLVGEVGLVPLATALVVYSPLVALGLINFHYGVGLLLIGIALHLAGRRWRWPIHLAVSSTMATAVFFAHALALAFFGLVLAALRVGELVHGARPTWRADGVLAGMFAVPACLWLLVKAPTHGAATQFGGWRERLDAVTAPSLYFQDSDLAVAGALLALVAWLVWRKRLVIPTEMQLPMVALTGIALVMPMQTSGVWLTHIRLPIIVALLFVAAVRVDVPDRWLRRAVVLALTVFLTVRLVTVERAVSHCDAKRLEVRDAVAALPVGHRLLPVIAPDAVTGDCLFSNYWHMPALAVIDRSALFPLMFVNMQPLSLAPDFRHLSRHQQRAAVADELTGRPRDAWGRVIAARWRRDFDHLFWMHPGVPQGKTPDGLTAVAHGSFFTIFRIAGPGG